MDDLREFPLARFEQRRSRLLTVAQDYFKIFMGLPTTGGAPPAQEMKEQE